MRRRTALALAALLTAGAAAGVAATGDGTRVSVSDAGAEANAAAEGTALSADGRFVAFASTAKLTAADTNGKKQLYVRDRQTGRTLLASANAAGAAGNGDVNPGDSFNTFFDITGDGRYAVFVSAATNLAGETTPNGGVFRKDLQTGAVTLVSVNSAGQQANAAVAGDPSVSGDGTRVAFTTGTATNLFTGDSGVASDVVLRDIAAGTTVLVSRSTSGAQANGTSERPSISADGRVVAFEAVLDSTNLFDGDTNNANDIVVRDLAKGTTVPAGVAADGTVKGGNIPDISGDGRYVVFQTSDSLDPVNDASGADVYRRDLRSGVTTLVSARTGADGRGNGDSRIASISADGTRVAFESAATDLTAADGNAATNDVYVRDVAARTTVRGSARADGTQADNASATGVVAPNGGPVTFIYDDAGNKPFATGDLNLLPDVFLKELAASDTTGPAITVNGPAAPVAGDTAQLTGTVADPSGVAALTMDGTAVPVAADGTFSATVRLGAAGTATTATLTARDGAGVTSTAARTITRARGAGTAAPKATALKVTRRGNRVTLRFRLTARATVTVRVLRAGRPAGPAVTRRLAPGTRTLVVRLPRVRPGAHRVVVTVRAGGRSTTAATRFTVRG
ncbi:MAG: hypothetical protein U0237_10935 [Thermoleophilia bacterium]